MTTALHDAAHAWLLTSFGAIREHVLFSSLVLLLLLAVASLPRIRPRTRYTLVLLGVAKFLVPGPLLAGIAGSITMHRVPIPSFSFGPAFAIAAGPATEHEGLCVAAAVWLLGAAAVAIRAAAVELRWRRTALRATAPSPRESETLTRLLQGTRLTAPPRIARCPAGLPVTAGVLRPVVLLPDCCADRLDDVELEAVLAHELAHVERRHNLGGLLQNAALALFWFDPLLWIANVRLHAEAEKDCDERVLDFVPDPPRYLSGMLKASYGFIAPQPAGVSCMSASHLKERMDHLMKHHRSKSRSVPHRLAIATGAAAIAAATVFVSAGEPPRPAPAAPAAQQKDDITLPKVLTKVDPVYPESARANRVQGLVVVAALIDRKGHVSEVSVARGLEGEDGKALENAALAAVKQWTFEPARNRKGKPVATTFNVTLNFKLH